MADIYRKRIIVPENLPEVLINKSILNKGLAEAASNPNKERIVSYCRELWQLLPNPKGSSRDDILGN